MKIISRPQFSENPDLTVIFTNAIKEEAYEDIASAHKGSRGKSGASYRAKGQPSAARTYFDEQVHIYSSDSFFYNAIVSYIKNRFFCVTENATFSLYEQGKFHELRYVTVPLYSQSEGRSSSRSMSSQQANLGEKSAKYTLTPSEFIDKVRHLMANLISRERSARKWEFDLSAVSNIVSAFNLHESDFIEALIEGLSLGLYQFSYQTGKKPELDHTVVLVGSSLERSDLTYVIRRGVHIAEAIKFARTLANAAPNYLTISRFVKEAHHVAKENKLKFTEINYQRLLKEGFGGLLAVNSGSAERARLLTLEYAPAKATQTILLVGKGVLFDSGGLSIKPSAGMAEMKMDMSGAAVVLAVMKAVRQLALNVRVIAALPLTDNVISSNAFRVGDVLTLYNGKRVEVLNTDAEGRLILADALSYAIKKYRPNYTIDFATLTGACMVALGQHYAGLWSNSRDLAEALLHAGEETSELLWQMPLHRAYLNDLNSPIADLKNIGGSYGGANTAAKFLEQFVANANWAHIDMAGTMSYQTNAGYKKKGASGFGVRLALRFLTGKD
ncbi:cytosol aminopeptidase [Spirochaetota bacterium]|nr:cytosol aminopeptidase [Spirochaetota bacterium]